ncbi:hypothetical protein [Pseudovibrio sp. SCP19]|uniref:hypothetical protein n=1 Tax=Pseudovibrio sp. SCP19 TaxID=3141374 RepID=UPI00333B1EB4
MIRRLYLLGLFIVLLSFSSISNAETYRCVTMSSVGFEADQNWQPAKFADRPVYLIRKMDEAERDNILIFPDPKINGRFSKEGELVEKGFCEISKLEINCNSSLGELYMAQENGRFTLTRDRGYILNLDEDIFLDIGTCSLLEQDH